MKLKYKNTVFDVAPFDAVEKVTSATANGVNVAAMTVVGTPYTERPEDYRDAEEILAFTVLVPINRAPVPIRFFR